MSRVVMESPEDVNFAASHHWKVQEVVDDVMDQIHDRAEAKLLMVRATTTHTKFSSIRKNNPIPAHQTKIKSRRVDVDALVWMEGDNAVAIEFGHIRSGKFENYGRNPQGLYIISSSALGITNIRNMT